MHCSYSLDQYYYIIVLTATFGMNVRHNKHVVAMRSAPEKTSSVTFSRAPKATVMAAVETIAIVEI